MLPRSLPRLLSVVFASVLCSQAPGIGQEPAPAPAAPAAADPEKVDKLISEAGSLQSRKRYIDALAKLDEAEVLDPKRADLFNVRGAIYLGAQLRDADRARAEFTKARDLMPEAMPPYFNLAEVDFVLHRWDVAEKSFHEVLTKFPKLPASVKHLVLYKVLMCQVKQDRLDDAQKLVDQHFTFMDDTPAYYFSKAVIALAQKKEKEGNEWLAKGQLIFKPPHSTAYVDSLMEAGYISEMSLGKQEPGEAGKDPENP